MKILLLGLGRFGRAIADRLLSYGHSLLAVEYDPFAVEKFLKTRDEKILKNLRVCIGDATSLLVWEYLPLEEFDLIISSLRSSSFNKTICEIVRDIYKNYDIPILVLAFDNSHEDFFSNYNCKTFILPELAAGFVEGFTLKNIVKPVGIGLGKNEILEATVSSKSPYTKVPIYPGRLRHWKLGLVYRGDRIILPKKRIVLKSGDRVIILGDDPRVVLEVAKAMAFGEPQFPLSYGENLLIYLRENELHYLKEYYYLWKHSRVKNVVLFTDSVEREKLREFVGDKKFLANLIVEKGDDYSLLLKKNIQGNFSAGLISAPYRRRFLYIYNYNLKRFFGQETPFLIPRLSFPYRRILVSLNTENPQSMVEPVFEIFQLLKGERLTFSVVVLPEVLVPKSEREKLQKTLSLIDEYSKLYGLKNRVEITKREGNPKRETLKEVKNSDLLIVGYQPRKIGLLEPYTPYLLAKESTKTVLAIPTEEGEF